MSSTEITLELLQASADRGSYRRGEEYFQDGNVLSCTEGADGLEGVVSGTEDYRVQVRASGDSLASGCTCPVASGMCKHAVALVLCFLDRQGQAEARPAAGAPRSAAPAPAAVADAFATAAELEQFVDAHQVHHALAVTADSLLAELPRQTGEPYWIRGVLGQLSVRDVGSLAGAARHARQRGLDVEIARAAFRALHRAAEAVRDGLAEERARPEAAADPALAPLWAQLLELRRAARAAAAPRSRAARAGGAWSFDPSACAITWKERARVLRKRDFGSVAIASRLEMTGGPGGAPKLECTCDPREPRCAHAVALLDTTLDLLGDPARAEQARALAEDLLRPAWDRALRELDLLEAQQAKPRAAIEVWWVVDEVLGRPALSARVKKQTKRGMSSGAHMSAERLLDEHRASLSEVDLAIAEHLAAFVPPSRGSYAGPRNGPSYPARAFAALVGHPRAVTDDAPDEPLEVRRVDLGFNAVDADGQIRLEPAVLGERVSPKLLEALLEAFPPGEPIVAIDPERRRCLLIDAGEDARHLWGVLAKHGDAFPPESHAALLERLARLETRLPLSVPNALKGRQLAARPVAVVRVRLIAGPVVLAPSLELELFVRPGPGAPLYPPGVGPRDVMLSVRGERRYVRRDLSGEPDWARERLAQLPLDTAEEAPPGCFQVAASDEAIALIGALQAPLEGLEVEWLDERPTVSRSPKLEALRVSVERKRDWFGITGELKIEAGRLELAVLLDAARRQQRFVRVDGQRWVELSDTLRRHLLAVADQTFAARAHLELSPGAVPAIRALAEAGAKVDTAPAWDELTQRLASATALRPRPPASLASTLRDYQIEGHAWLTRVAAWGAGAVLADDMGLGKTVQAIAVLLDRAKLGPALVLAPMSVTYNWVDELRKFAPGLRPILYTEQSDRAQVLPALRKKDVLIASYGLLVRDAEQLAARPFATLVLDEAQAIKNATTQRARAARNLDAGFRVAMSGTPLENHLGELWSLYAVVFPGLLGSWEQFRERFAGPIERPRAATPRSSEATDRGAQRSDQDARAALARVLKPFLLRRTKREVARELPSRTEIQVPIALSAEEQALYEDARLAAVAELTGATKGKRDEQRRFQILAALTRLRLLSSHPRLYDPTSKVPSSKLRRLVELLEELREGGHRALVFSQFTSHLAIVREELAREGFRALYLDGATPGPERAARIAAFQGGDGDVFLISLKAGGTGLNLTAADYVIHLDPWWNPAVEDQATDRAHRIGQTKPVTVYRLIARGTIEEQILSLHGDKRALVAGVLEGTDGAARMTTRDLLALLRAPA